ncbi:MAG: hypothetical protein F6K36_07245 [Symploca sp. SIO3C6]|nr:hypothetical protein [Symploca sp. SIO3C6]NET04016.1 hypothetical protein [Symploca sp. SIO2B6]
MPALQIYKNWDASNLIVPHYSTLANDYFAKLSSLAGILGATQFYTLDNQDNDRLPFSTGGYAF